MKKMKKSGFWVRFFAFFSFFGYNKVVYLPQIMLTVEQKSTVEQHLSKPQILVEKTKEQMFSVFQFDKKDMLTEEQLEESRKDLINSKIKKIRKTPTIKDIFPLKKQKVKNEQVKQSIIHAKTYLAGYLEKHKIKIPEDFLDNIEINSVKWISEWGKGGGAYLYWEIIYDKKTIQSWCKDRQILFFIHELVHAISKRDFKLLKKGTNNIRSSNIWFHNELSLWKDIGKFINEWFTDIIAFNVCKDNGISIKLSRDKKYSKSVYMIDKLINHLAENNSEQYHKIMDYLIKGNLFGDLRYMLIVKDSLGKEFTDRLWSLSFKDIDGVIQFMNDYPEVFGEKKISPYIQDYIWPIDWEYPFEEKDE